MPIAFGYPGNTNPEDLEKDDTLKPIIDFLDQLPTEDIGDTDEPAIQAIAEAPALLTFFGIEN